MGLVSSEEIGQRSRKGPLYDEASLLNVRFSLEAGVQKFCKIAPPEWKGQRNRICHIALAPKDRTWCISFGSSGCLVSRRSSSR